MNDFVQFSRTKLDVSAHHRQHDWKSAHL